ncbi:COMM domain-containing protein 5 [Hydra vulgaris]|uniref:COMM domain-containing protein 5 n=1 Tax=Hydra vulgaris TaxID=6087 RepID=UPI001F5F5002|nr:COMM domain-containing protein 5-like [Hydra vulgaris]
MAGRERVASFKKTNVQLDQSAFLPAKIPSVILKLSGVSSKINRDLFRKVLQVVIKDIEGSVIITEDIFGNLKSLFENVITEDKFLILYSGVLLLMRYALRHPQGSLKKESFILELNELRLNKEHIEDICSVVFTTKQNAIEKKFSSFQLPSLISLRWRIDVTISTSVLNRVLQPTILMQIKDSNGKMFTFEVSYAKFHELRYNIASLLKEMEDLEKRSVLRVEH